MIRIAIAEDHQSLIDGLELLLKYEDGITIVGTANDGEALLEIVRKKRPTVVVTDIRMPKMDGIQATRLIKKEFPELVLISDVALDPYNSDGHDGIVAKGMVDNDQSLKALAKMSLVQAEAGFDILGPSDMMDGRIATMRNALDKSGYENTGIMSYTAKYASAFYGPFRDALGSAPVLLKGVPKNKKGYQMNPANKREALIEAELDMLEGADYLMVKPAIHYLDVIHTLKENFNLPLVAYHVSGECAMLIAACQNGWLTYEEAIPEALLCIKRAGADVILSYFAKDYLKLTQ